MSRHGAPTWWIHPYELRVGGAPALARSWAEALVEALAPDLRVGLFDGEGSRDPLVLQTRFADCDGVLLLEDPEGRAAVLDDAGEPVLPVAEKLRARWREQAARVPVCGLVLSGGHSRRMGRDKALLELEDRPQALAAFELLHPRCTEVFLSCRAGQWVGTELADVPRLEDRLLEVGPLGGILTAFLERPDAAWLVVACDLPLLDGDTLDFLLRHRRPQGVATAYRSAHDGLPEPLCALYEPRARAALFHWRGMGLRCPRRILMRSRVELLELPRPGALDNVNRPEEWSAVRSRVQKQGGDLT